jgi:GNAT superfamily N-acetyltransferase
MPDLELKHESFDSPAARALTEMVQQEYVERYGGVDETVLDVADFAPPNGGFVVAYLDGAPVACGGWRALPDWPGSAEIKRMYVVPAYRRRGLARFVLLALEDAAGAAGHQQMWLETGERQPEAMQLYVSAGYQPIDGYGHYRDARLARSMGKKLGRPTS